MALKLGIVEILQKSVGGMAFAKRGPARSPFKLLARYFFIDAARKRNGLSQEGAASPLNIRKESRK